MGKSPVAILPNSPSFRFINSSFHAILNSFQKSGRIRALTGDNDPVKERPHIFWESDLAKLMEGVFFSIQQEKDQKLEQICFTVFATFRMLKRKEGTGIKPSYGSGLRVPT